MYIYIYIFIQIDECDRLWVLDTGKINEEHVCPAQLLAFDLKSDHLIKRARIPHKIATNIITKKGLLVTPVVETEGVYCSKTFVSKIHIYCSLFFFLFS